MSRTIRTVALIGLATLLLSACAAPAEENDGDGSTVRFALDWTPNTNHTGFYVAQEKGYFADAGLTVETIDYNNVLPDTLLDAGHADFGVSFHDASTLAQASGARVVTVMAVLQNWASAIGIAANNTSITRPADLDGTTYAGFGEPAEIPLLTQVIKNDGGTGEFDSVVLGTQSYEALYSGDADFVIPFFTWEGVEAERRGTPMTYFRFTDYGVPSAYSVVINASRDWADAHPAESAAFVQALQKGYQYAAEHPDEAADILLEANPDLLTDEKIVHESQRLLSSTLMMDAQGTVGTLESERWAGYANFLFDNKLLSDADGNPLAERPDWDTYFTNKYLAD
ncbi:ABC transporter substrate-binding protein [Klugiella xanthotipulae]|uniref:Thiamine pyrimidine synthase n=1 Tax=Klugiella xanthotipulae TaxID=244735 RepID=A0A543HSZ4_9MICO|nr:ABC transporter substrate-binding protein [Klugiella xanthotipulae]TQM61461.1 ABC-type nitrate/sulfonate/bicarbonate transport system substrate-binding protein [Klugiella xanthotipulae]